MSAAEVAKRFPDVTPARLAVTVKLRADQSKKVRTIVDMRRNGSNGKIKLRERLVLPRISDFVESMLDLWEGVEASLGIGQHTWLAPHILASRRGQFEVELFVIDFKDAFYTMTVLENERKYIIAKGLEFLYNFLVAAFGIASGPLLWGRLAALASRLVQAIFSV